MKWFSIYFTYSCHLTFSSLNLLSNVVAPYNVCSVFFNSVFKISASEVLFAKLSLNSETLLSNSTIYNSQVLSLYLFSSNYKLTLFNFSSRGYTLSNTMEYYKIAVTQSERGPAAKDAL